MQDRESSTGNVAHTAQTNSEYDADSSVGSIERISVDQRGENGVDVS
jgi:hypothetical protein